MSELNDEKLTKFLLLILRIEKQYAHVLRGVKTERQEAVMEAINQFCAKELEKP